MSETEQQTEADLMKAKEAERVKEQMLKEEAEKKAIMEAKKASKKAKEAEKAKAPEKTPEIDDKKYKTEKYMLVRQTIKFSVSQANNLGTNTKYDFAKDNWVKIEKSPPDAVLSDEEYFLKKTERNAHWQVKHEKRMVYEQAFFVKFNGTVYKPHSIELVGDYDADMKQRKTLISLKVGEWEKVNREMYDKISAKAAGGAKVWEVKIENVPVEV